MGKTYMACAGIRSMERELSEETKRKQSGRRILKMGMSILSYLEGRTVRGPQGEVPFQVKIGLHAGQVIAGVVGSHKPQFSLIGDTINTTARMCALSLPNVIQISSQFYNRLKGLVSPTLCTFRHRNIPVYYIYIYIGERER